MMDQSQRAVFGSSMPLPKSQKHVQHDNFAPRDNKLEDASIISNHLEETLHKERMENDDDEMTEEIHFIVDLLQCIDSGDPEQMNEATSKGNSLIQWDEMEHLLASGDGFSEECRSILDHPIADSGTTSPEKEKEEFKESDVKDKEAAISLKDFWKDLSEEDIRERRANRGERKVKSDMLRQQGNICCVRKTFAEAVRCYTEAIEMVRDSATLYNNRAFAYIKSGKYDMAVQDCNKAIFIAPYSLKARLFRAKALYMDEKYAQCLVCLQETRTVMPHSCELVDRFEKKLFDPSLTKTKTSVDDVFSSERFMKVAAEYDVAKMMSFYDKPAMFRKH